MYVSTTLENRRLTRDRQKNSDSLAQIEFSLMADALLTNGTCIDDPSIIKQTTGVIRAGEASQPIPPAMRYSRPFLSVHFPWLCHLD